MVSELLAVQVVLQKQCDLLRYLYNFESKAVFLGQDSIHSTREGAALISFIIAHSLVPKLLIVSEINTDQEFNILCSTETCIKPNEYVALREASPASSPKQSKHRKYSCSTTMLS